MQDFVEEYFYLNPISQLGLVVTRSKRAELISELAGNPRQHIDSIKRLGQGESECTGEPSLQNSLELTIQTLRHMPPHASREVSIGIVSFMSGSRKNDESHNKLYQYSIAGANYYWKSDYL